MPQSKLEKDVKQMTKGNKTRIVGEIINFKNLRHAPVNELGVVFLFGYIHESLGIYVESIESSYPDCLAKRKLQDGRYEHLRIEFEYKSSNFIKHGHDPSKVDTIVCWSHDSNEIDENVEVIELKSLLSSEMEIKPPPKIPRLNKWQEFCREKRKEGLSFKEISEQYKKLR